MALQTFSRQSQLAWQNEATSQDFRHYLQVTQRLLDSIHGQDSLTSRLCQPFEWAPPDFWTQDQTQRRGILLVHGLLDSPNRMRDLAKTYLEQGYLVRTILLTGHGLIPKALNVIHKEDWLALVQFAITQLQKDTGACVLLGYSGGGTLCLWHLLAYEPTPSSIQCVIAIAPAIKLKDPLSMLLPLLRLIPYAFMLNRQSITETAQYTRFSQHFGYQTHQLAEQVRTLMAQQALPVPAYFVLAAHDETINSYTAKAALLNDNNPAHRVCWFSRQQPLITDARILWHTSVYPAFHIDDFSHISLCTRVDNPDYGIIAYLTACASTGKRIRPCFNPDYDAMTRRLLAFSNDASCYD